jgi:branched-chain amino acid aminotransferase group I
MQQYNPKNDHIKVYVNGELLHRNEAKISVFDSIVQGGDAVWEGLRVYNGRIFALDRHLNRLQESAHTMSFADIPSSASIKQALFSTLAANGMTDNTHIRLTLTRGEKTTSGMDPRLNKFGCGLIILAEWKAPIYPTSGVSLITSSIRRNTPQCLDSKIHHNNLINNILAKIEANLAGVSGAVMLDTNGYVSEVNATNIFMVKKDQLYTPYADSCLPGITRGIILELATNNGIKAYEKNISLHELYNADEVFTTGTMGELTKVNAIDNRNICNKFGSSTLARLQELFSSLTKKSGTPLPL